MKLAIVFLGCIAIVAGVSTLKKKSLPPLPKFADVLTLQKQKFLLEILNHIHQPLVNPEYLKDGSTYVQEAASYVDYDPLEFTTLYDNGVLPRGEIFSIFNQQHLKEAISLFNLFFNAKDWTTFYKNVIWARQNINEAMFVYALTVAVVHRKDMVGIVLPAPYEICPYLFYNGQVINDAQNWKLKAKAVKPNIYTVPANYTSDFYLMNNEGNLAYFTEDIGLNSYYYYYHVDYPFWMDGKKFGLDKDRRGELFLYKHQQLLARYYLERLANRMGDIEEFQWMSPIKTGYNPQMRYYNGMPFTLRKNDYEVYSLDDYSTLNRVDDYERRIRDVIDYGYFTTRDGQKIDFRKPESIEYIGNIIQGNPESLDTRFFGYLTLITHTLLGGVNFDSNNDYKVIPSVLEHFETAMRDPVFYQLYNRLLKHYFRFKQFLPSYTTEQLMMPNVTISKVTVGKLTTYFEPFDADITTLVDLTATNLTSMLSTSISGEPIPVLTKVATKTSKDFMLTASQMRLGHKPFGIAIDVSSDKLQKAIVRLFLGPKYDHYGNLYSLNDNKENFVEIDQFPYDLPIGNSTILRSSKEFTSTVKDRTSYTDIYRKVLLAMTGLIPFPLDMTEAHCGFPDRLLLPKGWATGLPMQLVVVLTPYVDSGVPQYSNYDSTQSCGIGSGTRYIDDLPFGFPFDREINEDEFTTPNMYFKDVLIYHKTS